MHIKAASDEKRDKASHAEVRDPVCDLAQRLEPALARNGGRLVKHTGDGALAEFGSAVDALRAAIEFQQAVNCVIQLPRCKLIVTKTAIFPQLAIRRQFSSRRLESRKQRTAPASQISALPCAEADRSRPFPASRRRLELHMQAGERLCRRRIRGRPFPSATRSVVLKALAAEFGDRVLDADTARHGLALTLNEMHLREVSASGCGAGAQR